MSREVTWKCDRCSAIVFAPRDADEGWAPALFWRVTAAPLRSPESEKGVDVCAKCSRSMFEPLPVAAEPMERAS